MDKSEKDVLGEEKDEDTLRIKSFHFNKDISITVNQQVYNVTKLVAMPQSEFVALRKTVENDIALRLAQLDARQPTAETTKEMRDAFTNESATLQAHIMAKWQVLESANINRMIRMLMEAQRKD